MNGKMIFTGNNPDDMSSITAKDLGTKGREIIIQLSSKDLVYQILMLSESMQEAIAQNGYSEDAGQALFLFISEISNNALKARGSLELYNKYGTFEHFAASYPNHRDIINKVIEKNYAGTVINVKWKLAGDCLLLEISNNTALNDYFEQRVSEAMNKPPNITEEFIEQLSSGDSIFDTKASGIGMGLSMASSYAVIAGGSVEYDKSKDGWTTFRLRLNKQN